MNAVRLVELLLVLVACCDTCHQNNSTRVDRAKLYFKVSARNLERSYQPVYRPYVYVDVTEDNGKTLEFVGQSEYAPSCSEDPQWNKTFFLSFNRTKNQKLSFLINEPNMKENNRHYITTLVNVSEYFDNGEKLTVPIGESSFIDIRKTLDNIESATPYEDPYKYQLNFTVLASQREINNLTTLYKFQGSPFVVTIFFQHDNGTRTKLGETESYSLSNMSKMKDVYSVHYDPYLNERLYFEVNGSDGYRGHPCFLVNDYVGWGQKKMLTLKNGGSISIRNLRTTDKILNFLLFDM